MGFFDKETRIKNTNLIIDKIIKMILPFTFNSKIIAGYITTIIHILFGITVISNLIKTDNNHTLYIFTIIWILVIYSNYYFKGCILARVEKSLFNDDNWTGPASLVFFFTKVNKDYVNNFIKYCIAAPMCTYLIFKYIFLKKNYIALFLMLIYIPLLMINPQYNLFDNIFIKYTKKYLFDSDIIINDKYNNKYNNKIIVISGTTSGIGNDFVNFLLNNTNSKLVLLNRTSENFMKYKNRLNEKYKKRINFIECDFLNFKSVKKCYDKINKLYPNGIDCLINNAGITNANNVCTDDEYNVQIQTNFLSHALLMELFIKKQKKRKEQLEILNISSISHFIPNNEYNKFMLYKNCTLYDSQDYYQQSKLCMLLYINYLNKNIINNKSNIKIYSLHPGIIKTNLFEKSILSTHIQYILNNFVCQDVCNSTKKIQFILFNNKINNNGFYYPNYSSDALNKLNNDEMINDKDSKNVYLKIKSILDEL